MHALPRSLVVSVVVGAICAPYSAYAGESTVSARAGASPAPTIDVARVQLKDIASGTLLIPDPKEPGVYIQAPINETKVDIKVTGLVTRTTVRQKFTNPSHEQ